MGKHRDVYRSAVSPAIGDITSLTWLVAIIVACLASFRQLFIKSAQTTFNRELQLAPSRSKRLLPSVVASRSKSSLEGGRLEANQWVLERPSQESEAGHSIPLDKIYVQHTVDTMSSSLEAGMQAPQAVVQSSAYNRSPVHYGDVSASRSW